MEEGGSRGREREGRREREGGRMDREDMEEGDRRGRGRKEGWRERERTWEERGRRRRQGVRGGREWRVEDPCKERVGNVK